MHLKSLAMIPYKLLCDISIDPKIALYTSFLTIYSMVKNSLMYHQALDSEIYFNQQLSLIVLKLMGHFIYASCDINIFI